MVIITESVPFSMSIGLDLSLNEEFDFNNALTYINTLQEINIDYIVSPISIKNQEIRRNVCRIEKSLNSTNDKKIEFSNYDKPIFINDFQMKFFYWKNKFISKIHDIDLEDIPQNYDIISQDLNYANYINSKSSILEIDLKKIIEKDLINLKNISNEKGKEKDIIENQTDSNVYNKTKLQCGFYLVKLIKQFFAENIGRHLTIILKFTKENYYFYTKFQTQINNVDNFEVILKIDEDLPDEVKIKYLLLFSFIYL